MEEKLKAEINELRDSSPRGQDDKNRTIETLRDDNDRLTRKLAEEKKVSTEVTSGTATGVESDS